MKKNTTIGGLFFIYFLTIAGISNSQQTLWFGIMKMQHKIHQARFEVFRDSIFKTIVYAPYGISPTEFNNVKEKNNQLTFSWQIDQLTYRCLLIKQDSSVYSGNCTCEKQEPIQLIIRTFTNEDAILQGNSLQPGQKDIQIIDRALTLLNNGASWNRNDNRICDNTPNKWSLFCSLHQASIDIDSTYKHLRPAIQAARQAINEATANKQYEHVLRDFNNESLDFESISKVLIRAKEIIKEKLNFKQ